MKQITVTCYPNKETHEIHERIREYDGDARELIIWDEFYQGFTIDLKKLLLKDEDLSNYEKKVDTNMLVEMYA